jgi:RNA polymerase sigma-70 factor (ECF subfamily)
VTDFGTLLEHEIPRLRRYARALTRDATATEDLVQNCLLRALTRSHLWQPGTNLRAWLFTILHNQHVNELRSHARSRMSVPLDDVESMLWEPPAQGMALQLRDLSRALDGLPQHQRQTLLLVGLEDMSYDEVAQSMSVSVGTVRSRLNRGRKMLRQLQGEDGGAAGRAEGRHGSAGDPRKAPRDDAQCEIALAA